MYELDTECYRTMELRADSQSAVEYSDLRHLERPSRSTSQAEDYSGEEVSRVAWVMLRSPHGDWTLLSDVCLHRDVRVLLPFWSSGDLREAS